VMPELLDAFAGLRLLVVGEAVLDGWVSGPSRALSREGPVPVVSVTETVHVPGAAGHAAAQAVALGADVRLLSVVGEDADGTVLRRALAERGVASDDLLVEPGRATVAKRRILSGGQLLVRCDSGDVGPQAPAVQRSVLACLAALVPAASAILVCDYDAGMFTPAVRAELAGLVARQSALLVVDAHRPLRWARAGARVVTPNAAEAECLLPGAARATYAVDRVRAVVEHAEDLVAAAGAGMVAVTLDRDGAVLLRPGRDPYRAPGQPASDSQAAGAGDTFAVAITLALAAGAEPEAAVDLAAAAAGLVVGRPGTSLCTAAELRDRLPGPPARRLLSHEVAGCADLHRALGRRIVFTNGCFDVLHSGHVAYLRAARALGDVLVVGLNSDSSVRRLKGPDRPVNPVEDRAAVLAELTCVDHIVVFDGDTPADLLRALRPDVYVKGGDYTEEMLPEAPLVRELGAELRIVDYVEDRSTTGLIERIRGSRSTVR
jgi:D-beta-D-heptose 7-phosphate kinase / D-beta-D-heptose 1-phosphate adenosyltransferase